MPPYSRELDEDQEEHSVIIDPSGGFQQELQKVIVTAQSIEQLKVLREMLRDSLSAVQMRGNSLVDDAISIAFLQGQLVVVDILTNSKKILHVDFGE